MTTDATSTDTTTATVSKTPPTGAQRWARRLTNWVDPANVIVAVSLAIGCGLYGWKGLGWAVIAIVFAAVLPMAYILYMRGGETWANRHLTDRQKRVTVLPVICVSVTIGLALEMATSAPDPLIAMTTAMFATITAIWPITALAKYQISAHVAVLSGSFAMLAQAYHPAWLTGFTLVAALAWARVTVREHTISQVITGGLLGTLIAGGVYAALQ
ncbi:hypothetical protein [Kitasatospora sp. NPDC093679]|uniref:hypothetical protein n=1 Tax=Kitasatospora sp. NPDC093679 TaxID=3154983 RepID=UPI00343576DF